MQIEANSTKQEGAVGKGKGKRDIDWCFNFRKLVEIFCLQQFQISFNHAGTGLKPKFFSRKPTRTVLSFRKWDVSSLYKYIFTSRYSEKSVYIEKKFTS